MENESLFNERQSIRDSARQLKKYGSTCNHVRNNEFLIRHNLEQSDTLQGIALKYGCTTEQIRRVNRLFAQDSLFLRQYLMIPVDRDTSIQHNQLTNSQSAVTHNEDLPPSPQSSSSLIWLPTTSNDRKNLTMHRNDSADVVLSPEEENKKSIEDFLGKIDSTLAKTKKYVASSHVRNSQSSLNALTALDDNNDLQTSSHAAAAFALSSSYQSKNYRDGGGGSSSNNGTQLVVTHGRRVKSSLHRLEEQQDEFYQL